MENLCLNVLTSEIKSHRRPGVATIISGHLRRSLCCFCGAMPPTTATILRKTNREQICKYQGQVLPLRIYGPNVKIISHEISRKT